VAGKRVVVDINIAVLILVRFAGLVVRGRKQGKLVMVECSENPG
jgi:hypothetical protein